MPTVAASKELVREVSETEAERPRRRRASHASGRERRESQRAELRAELAALETLPHAALKERWRALYGSPAPRQIKRILLLRAVAYRMQEQVLGGLDLATRQRLEEAAEELCAGRASKRRSGGPVPGTRLLREWRGEMHEVIVLDAGVEYRGEHFASLSAVARAITGARWSGPRFFGLRSGKRERS